MKCSKDNTCNKLSQASRARIPQREMQERTSPPAPRVSEIAVPKGSELWKCCIVTLVLNKRCPSVHKQSKCYEESCSEKTHLTLFHPEFFLWVISINITKQICG